MSRLTTNWAISPTLRALGLFVAVLALFPKAVGAAIPEQRNTAAISLERPDSLFYLALEHFDAAELVEARWIFEGLARNLPRDTPWRAASRLMWARSLYRLGDLAGAESAVTPLLQGISEPATSGPGPAKATTYAIHARHLLALTSWRSGRYAETIRHAQSVASSPLAPEAIRREARVIGLAATARTEDSGSAVADSAVASFARDASQLNRAIALFRASQMTAARLVLEQLQRSSPNTPFTEEISALLADVQSYEQAEIRLAVLAPLVGEDSISGAALRDGVRFAFDRLAPPGLSPLVLKSAVSPVETIHAIEDCSRDTTILAVIGPLTTDNAIVAGAAANAFGLPMVTPTASGEGVCGIGRNIFQINLTARTQGSFLASIVADSLRAQTVAILSTYDPNDQGLASEFSRAVRAKGLTVVAQEFFITGTTDLTRPLTAIRRAALQRTPPPADVDTARFIPEISSIDVMLVCSSHEADLVAVAAQIPTQKIWTRVVGNATWGNPAVRQQSGEAAEGVIFATTFDRSYPEAQVFVDAYREARGEEPSLAAALSYDAASLVFQAISTGARNRAQVREFLGTVRNWPGVTGHITLGPDGCNSVPMVRIIRGGVVKPVTDWALLSRSATQSESTGPPAGD